MDLKVYGAFRSGTNYVKTLMELNYDARVLNGSGGFKHAPIPAVFGEDGWTPPELPSLGVVKNPWSWLPSMWRYVQGNGSRHTECASSWEAFLVSPLVVSHGNRDGFPRFWFRTPVDYWLAMAHSLANGATQVIRYEDVLERPRATCDAIASAMAIDRTSTDFLVPATRTRNMADRERGQLRDYVSDEQFDSSYYDEQRFMDAYGPEEENAVRALLDDDIARLVGYAEVT